MCHCQPWNFADPSSERTALVVEKPGPLREAVSQALKLQGFDVVVADDVTQAFVFLPYVQPDLVLGSLPRHHLGAVKSFCPRAVRVVLTDIRPTAVQATGAEIALVKPFGARELMRALEVAGKLAAAR